jgi:dipeptide/tripeptide permease
VLVATSVKAETEYGLAFGGLLTSMVLIGLGVGGCRATVTPLMNQCPYNSCRTNLLICLSGPVSSN